MMSGPNQPCGRSFTHSESSEQVVGPVSSVASVASVGELSLELVSPGDVVVGDSVVLGLVVASPLLLASLSVPVDGESFEPHAGMNTSNPVKAGRER
jgi:hypothetical protein